MAIVDNYIRFAPGELKRKDQNRLIDFLTFFPTQEAVTTSYRLNPSTGRLWVPRGVLDKVPDYVRLKDRRSFPKLEKFEPDIELDYQSPDKDGKKFYGQMDCVEAMRELKQGSIHRQPGSGKTEIACYFIATVGTRSMVIVHTEDILAQWYDRARDLIPGMDVGLIRGQQFDFESQLVIATVQTMSRRLPELSREFWRMFGCTILDECHHGAARTFDNVISHSTSRYRFGFSASKTRADNMQNIIRYNFGPMIHDQKFAAPIPVTVEKINTKFRPGISVTGNMHQRRWRWQKMITKLISDPRRNRQIAKWVAAKLDEGRSTLVLSRRIDHLEAIAEILERKYGYDPVILAAKLMAKPERRKMVEAFRNGDIKCVLATQLADEALDVPILSAVALAYPGKHTDLILQQVGRALREHTGKVDAVIGDFCDKNVKSLRSQYHGRRSFYLHAGFKIKGKDLRGRMNPTVKKARAVVTGRIR